MLHYIERPTKAQHVGNKRTEPKIEIGSEGKETIQYEKAGTKL